MSVLTKISKVFGGKPRREASRSAFAAPVDADAERDTSPVAIDLHGSDPGDNTTHGVLEPAPKSKQEMLAELQKNYADAVELMRKVDRHMDRQEERAERLLEIAERIPAALEVLPVIREHAGELASAVDRLSAAADRGIAANEAQQETLARVREFAERSADAEEQIAGTLGEFRGTVDVMAGATDDLGKTLRSIQDRDQRRDDQLAELIGQNTKWMVTIVSICSVGLVVAIVLAIIAMG